MIATVLLLRPAVLGIKNSFRLKVKQKTFHRDLSMLLLIALLVGSVYFSAYNFLIHTLELELLSGVVPQKILRFGAFLLLLLLLLSQIITAIGLLYSSEDLPLLMGLPISSSQIYLLRLVQVAASGSWMLLVLTAPAIIAYQQALNLSVTFILWAAAVFLLLSLALAALSTLFVVLVVDFVPLSRLKEILAAFVVLAIALFLLSSPFEAREVEYQLNQRQGLVSALLSMSFLADPNPIWFPSSWVAEILINLSHSKVPTDFWLPLVLLCVWCAGTVAIGYLGFDYSFYRGWAKSTQASRSLRISPPALSLSLQRIVAPLGQQLNALILKEGRMFMRDTAQTLQLLFLLLLTFFYLYNFKTLRAVSDFSPEGTAWWHAILSIANFLLAACVVAAISTRFVFPSLSLEGRAYWLIRHAPISIEKLLIYKFAIWYPPIAVLSLVLFLSGGLAIQVPPEALTVFGVLALLLSIGIVGLGVGVGAVYARFDWQSPAQVAASFGSLIYMLFSIGLILVALLPTSFLLIISCVKGLAEQMDRTEMILTTACSYFLVMVINLSAARRALVAGVEALKEHEK